jgi:hypothetical protein
MAPTDDRTLTDPHGEPTTDTITDGEQTSHADLPAGETETFDEPDADEGEEPGAPAGDVFRSGP